MDDAISASAWRQPNTFMDIISPAIPKPRSVPARSSTLMRSAVQPPEPALTATAADNDTQTNFSPIRPDLSEAANSIKKSPLISHYPEAVSQYGATAITSSIVQPSVEAQTPAEVSSQVTAEQISNQATGTQNAATATDQTLPLATDIFVGSPAASITDIQQATKPKAGKRSLVKKASGWSVAAIIAIGIAAGGLYINSNLNKFELYVAASRAGFKATLPSVKPSGYALSSISTGSGVIETVFKSNSKGRNFSIEETKSSVSSGQLLSSFVLNKAGNNYQAITTDGRTIYVYNGHDATWVNQGIWYVVNDNNTLNNSQIIHIANSM